MFELDKITRPNILTLQPYSSARDEFTGSKGIFLDANENPFGELNRYPDPYQRELKKIIGGIKNVNENSTFIGNGSDEIIDLLFRIFCNPGSDKALTFSPTYGMYDVAAGINDTELIKIELNKDFDIDFEVIEPFLSDPSLKLILICSPNNPTGNCLNPEVIKKILEYFNGIVLIDEAYIDFSETASFINKIESYSNLVICQTMSKAYGLAAARVGMAFSNSSIIDLLNRVKPPYNVSELNQKAAIDTLKRSDEFESNKKNILAEKEKLLTELQSLNIIKKIYPSEANFFLVETENANAVYNILAEVKIIVRNRNEVVRNCIRITVGSAPENEALIKVLKTI
ncbi:MAG: histidinol-phosphate transaminase [Crocinitomicaceae bacterium]|nr:histidinol-phosphate transaminase [Crocinitomicaceae bacterium]